MACGGVGQVVDPTGEVELQVKLGNVQARVDSGHSVLAHSCKCELALVGRSINGSSLGHRHERFRLPAHLANDQCQRVTNSPAPLPSACRPAGSPIFPCPYSQTRLEGNSDTRGYFFLSPPLKIRATGFIGWSCLKPKSVRNQFPLLGGEDQGEGGCCNTNANELHDRPHRGP